MDSDADCNLPHRWWKLWEGLQRVCCPCLLSGPYFADIVHNNSVDRRSGETVAIKIIDIELAEDSIEEILQEISIMSGLSSPYVIQYHGSYLQGTKLWIIMEYCSGGSCYDLMRAEKIPEEHIAIVMKQLLRALDYLHSDEKMHRDIKGTALVV